MIRGIAHRNSHIFQSLKPLLYINPRSLQTPTQQSNCNLTTQICNHLLTRPAPNWDTLTAKFPSIILTNSLVESVLLNLNQPPNAKKALTFFHWSSHSQHFPHGLRSYCLLIHILVNAGLLADAHALLESCIHRNLAVVETLFETYELSLPGPRVFDLLIQTYSKMRMVELAFDACCYLCVHGFCSSVISFNAMLRVAQKSEKSDFAWKVYEYMLERRVNPNQASTEIMVSVMCKEGSLRKMMDVLDRINGKRCEPGMVVNFALGFRILGECRIEQGTVLLKRMMQKNLVLDVVMSSLVVYGYCKMGRLEMAYEVYEDMLKRGLGSNAFVHTCFIGAYCRSGEIEEAIRLMEEMVSIGLKPYKETYNFLMEGCCRTGRLEDSLNFYEKMIKKGFLPDCTACNEMMGRLCKAGMVDKANEILTVVIDGGFVPDKITYSKLMDGYGKIGKSQEILKLYYEMEHKGLAPDVMVDTCIIRNLCACGKLKEAENFLLQRARPSASAFDAIVQGYCSKGENMDRALYFYDEMIRKKFEPCAQTLMMLVRSMVEVNTVNCCNVKMLEILSSVVVPEISEVDLDNFVSKC